MKHASLLRNAGLETGDHIVGGTFKVTNGKYIFTENSGTYGRYWTPEIRNQFSDFMKNKTSVKIETLGFEK